jgi:hypothetical protein
VEQVKARKCGGWLSWPAIAKAGDAGVLFVDADRKAGNVCASEVRREVNDDQKRRKAQRKVGGAGRRVRKRGVDEAKSEK